MCRQTRASTSFPAWRRTHALTRIRLIELQDPDAVLSYLRQATAGIEDETGFLEMQSHFSRLEGRDAWIYEMSIGGFITIRLGLEIQDRFLILNNVPWSQKANIVDTLSAPLNGVRLQLNPPAGTLQLPGLHAAAVKQKRNASANGLWKVTSRCSGRYKPLSSLHPAPA